MESVSFKKHEIEGLLIFSKLMKFSCGIVIGSYWMELDGIGWYYKVLECFNWFRIVFE